MDVDPYIKGGISHREHSKGYQTPTWYQLGFNQIKFLLVVRNIHIIGDHEEIPATDATKFC